MAARGDAARLGRGAAAARRRAAARPAAASAVLLWAANALAMRRDVGSGLLPARDTAPPRLRLLGSPAGQALRSERGTLLATLVGIGAFASLACCRTRCRGALRGRATPARQARRLRRHHSRLPRIRLPLLRARHQPLLLLPALRPARGGGGATARNRARAPDRPSPLARRPAHSRGRRGVRARARLRRPRLGGRRLAGRRRLGPAHARGGRQTACLRRPSSSALGALAFALVPRAAPGVAYALVGVSSCRKPSAPCSKRRTGWSGSRPSTTSGSSPRSPSRQRWPWPCWPSRRLQRSESPWPSDGEISPGRSAEGRRANFNPFLMRKGPSKAASPELLKQPALDPGAGPRPRRLWRRRTSRTVAE